MELDDHWDVVISDEESKAIIIFHNLDGCPHDVILR